MSISRISAQSHSNSGAYGVFPTNVADEAIARLAVSISCVVYVVGYFGVCFNEHFNFLGTLIYLIPVILATPLLIQHTPRINEAASFLLFVYLSVSLFVYMLRSDYNHHSFNNYLFLTLIIICYVPTINVSFGKIQLIFYATVIYFVLNFFLANPGGIRFLEMFRSGTGSALGDSYSSNEGLLGPIYSIFFYGVGATGHFYLAALMTLWGGKRIGLLGLLIGLFLLFLFKKTSIFQKRFNRFFALLGILAVINIVGLNLILISEYLHQTLLIGPHIEEVMLGRHEISLSLANAVESRPTVEWIFGSGAGSADALAAQVANGDLPHNDWLKIFYDYGLLGSCAAVLFMALIFSSTITAAAIVVAIAIAMVTDNVMIYLFYQIPVVFMIAYCTKYKYLETKLSTRSCRKFAR